MESWSDADLDECRSIVACDYLKWRLQKIEFDWEDCPQLLSPNATLLKLHTFAYECETNSEPLLNKLVEQLDLSHQTTYPDFLRISERLLTKDDADDEITWECIGSVYALAGLCAIYCVHHELWTVIGLLTDC